MVWSQSDFFMYLKKEGPIYAFICTWVFDNLVMALWKIFDKLSFCTRWDSHLILYLPAWLVAVQFFSLFIEIRLTQYKINTRPDTVPSILPPNILWHCVHYFLFQAFVSILLHMYYYTIYTYTIYITWPYL